MPKIKIEEPEDKKSDGEKLKDENNFENAAPLENESESFEDEQDSPKDGLEAIENDSIPLEEKLDLIKAALESSEEKASEYLDGWQRTQAEFANYKKRVHRDRELFNQEAVGKVVRNYLPILDDLERALKDRPKDGDSAAWANGIELISRKMVTLLENDGVFPIDAAGEMFDPNLHEAIAQVPGGDHESGQIIEVVQTGYRIGERILRPARVVIAD
jgi:molecular chaperone GrpE